MQIDILIQDFFLLSSAHFLALISPGVDFFIIISSSIRYGKIAASLCAMGIAIANLFYIIIAYLGIIFIQDNSYIFNLIKLLGSFYLLYISYFLLKSKNRELFKKNEKKIKESNFLKDFFRGFTSAILNPKNSIFYFSIFSISLKSYTPFFMEIIYIAWMFLAVLIWNLFIIYLLEKEKIKSFLNKNIAFIEKICALFLSLISFYIIYSLLI